MFLLFNIKLIHAGFDFHFKCLLRSGRTSFGFFSVIFGSYCGVLTDSVVGLDKYPGVLVRNWI